MVVVVGFPSTDEDELDAAHVQGRHAGAHARYFLILSLRHDTPIHSPQLDTISRLLLIVVQAFRKMGTPSMAMPSFSWGNSPTTVPQLGSSTPHTLSDGTSGQSGDGLGLSGTGAGGEGTGVAATPRQVLLEEDTTGESGNSINSHATHEAACLTGSVCMRGIGPQLWLCITPFSEAPLCPRLLCLSVQ